MQKIADSGFCRFREAGPKRASPSMLLPDCQTRQHVSDLPIRNEHGLTETSVAGPKRASPSTLLPDCQIRQMFRPQSSCRDAVQDADTTAFRERSIMKLRTGLTAGMPAADVNLCGAPLRVEVASRKSELAQGLKYRRNLPAGEGILSPGEC